MSSSLRGSRLIDTAPPSISYDAQVQAASESLDQQCFSIIDDTNQVVMIPNITGLTDPVLIDVLAWQFHVDAYDPTKSLDFRKNLVQMSIQWHKTKGTLALLQEVIDTYWPGGATIQEWWEYKDPLPPNYPTTGWHDRYLFRIFVNQDVITPDDEASVLALINRYKPISRWCEEVLRSRSSNGTAYIAGYAQFHNYRKSRVAVRR